MDAARRINQPSIPRWIFWPTIVVVSVIYVLPGLFSSYRAWVQVQSLDLIVQRAAVQPGDTIRVQALSWGRTWVDVDLQLIQDGHSETLAAHEIPKNHNASIDPRWRRDSIVVVLTDRVLKGYKSGPAKLRATAVGGPQWLRTPPPLIREASVKLVSDS